MARDQQALAHAVLDASPEAFVAYSADGTVRLWNRAAEALTGWTRNEVLGLPDPTIPEGPDRAAFDELLARRHATVDDEAPGPTVLAPRRLCDGTVVTVRARGWNRTEADGQVVVVVTLGVVESEGTAGRVRDRFSRSLVEALSERDVEAIVAEAVRELAGGDHAVVLQPCADHSHLHTRSVLGTPDPAIASMLADLQLDVAEHPDAPWSRALAGQAVDGPGLPGHDGVVLWVPMGGEDDRWVLAIPTERGANVDQLRIDALAIADEAWVALQRAELVGDLEGQLEILMAITAVAGTDVVDLDETATRVARIAAASLGSARVAVYLAEDDRLELLSAHGFDPAVGDDGAAVAHAVVNDGRELVVADPSDLPTAAGPWSSEEGSGIVLGAPMRVGRRVVGALLASRPVGAAPFEQLTQQVAAALAQQAALAIGHAHLLSHEQQTVRRLQELDELKADWIAGLTHDLKAPLTGMLGFTRTLRRFGDDIPAGDRATYLATMDRQASRMVAMVDAMLLAARMEGGHVAPTRVERVNPAELLLEAVDTFDLEARERVHLTDVKVGGEVEGDRSQLLRVVTNLVDNALKYSPTDQPIEVRIEGDASEVRLTVEDRGPGIPVEHREVVFERYGRGDEGRDKGSTGLGLYIGRGIARGHGGDLQVKDGAHGGAAMLLVLPVQARDRVTQH